MEWDAAEKISQTIEHGVTAIALIVGASWAYFRFARFRTLKPRVRFTFEWTRADVNPTRSLLILTVKLSNKGRAKLLLRKDKEPRCFLKYGLIKESGTSGNIVLLNVPPRRLQPLDTVFAPHRWIEPGETIDDVKLIEVDRSGLLGIQIEVLVFGAKKYTAPGAISLVGMPVPACSDSEDEQDDYEEIECLNEKLGIVLKKLLGLGEESGKSIRGLTEKITKWQGRVEGVTQGRPAHKSMSSLMSEGEELKREADEVLRIRESG